MPNTYSQLYIQLVFAVKNRQSLIKEPFRERIEKYMCAVAAARKHKPLSIYCMPDHLHFLVGLNPDQSISNLVKELKQSSNNFINEQKFTNIKFNWQEGYGAFSYSRSGVDNVVQYIYDQPKHHQTKTFKEEYISFLQKFEIPFDQQYLFEFYN